MINSIHIKNFQSHEDSEFVLSPGVNAIVGESHVGKSAVRRLLHWVNTNRPLGDSFIKTGAKRAYGKIELDNGVVERTKTAKRSTYVVNGGEPYTAFGSSVPEEVTDLINVSDVNVQTQHGSFFLLMDTPGAVASYLRSVTGLDELSEVAADVASQLRSAKSQASACENREHGLIQEVEVLEEIDLDRLEECIQSYRECEKRNDTIRKEIDALSNIVEKLEDLFASPTVDIEYITDLFSSLEKVINFKETMEEKERSLESIVEKMEELDRDDIEIRDGLLEDVTDAIERFSVLTKEEAELSSSAKSMAVMLRDAMISDEELVDLRLEERDLLKQLNTCPLCGMELTDDARDHLIGDIK